MGWGWRGRGGGWAGPWPGRGPFSYLPPWQRPGWVFGYGRGFGQGFGRRFWGYQYNPSVCARFPWLPRWWWAYPEYRYRLPYATYGPRYGRELPYTAYGWGNSYPWSMYGMPGYGYPDPTYPYEYPPAPYMGYW